MTNSFCANVPNFIELLYFYDKNVILIGIPIQNFALALHFSCQIFMKNEVLEISFKVVNL